MTKPSKKRKPAGSPTNASDAVDDLKLPSRPTADEAQDHGVQETFPASDPVAVGSAVAKAKKTEPKPKPADIQPKRREPPDWLLGR
jgi:hypothetical protein